MMENWPEIEWDDDGYPTDDSLAAIKDLKLDFVEAAKFLRRELKRCSESCCAYYEENTVLDEDIDEDVVRADFSTGGWSGAEDLINTIFRRFDTKHFSVSWRRGGHYVFEFPTTGPFAAPIDSNIVA